jgi:hypothetical protein
MTALIADLEEKIARYSSLLRSIADERMRAELRRLLAEAKAELERLRPGGQDGAAA